MSGFRGRVVKRRVAAGSKSERHAVMLETDDGRFLLRRRAAHPFVDPVLDRLVGKAIRANGSVHGSSLIVDDWEEL